MPARTRGRDSFRSALAQQSVRSSVGGHGSGVFYPRLRRHRATVAKRDVRFWPILLKNSAAPETPRRMSYESRISTG